MIVVENEANIIIKSDINKQLRLVEGVNPETGDIVYNYFTEITSTIENKNILLSNIEEI